VVRPKKARKAFTALPTAPRIRLELAAARKPIGSNDLLIAAHAYALGATIVTANADEFKRVKRAERRKLACIRH
jgi:predicted nucleic acid-binding protein